MRKVFGIFISMFTVCFAQTKIQKEIGLSQSPAGRLASGAGGESSIPDETEAMEAMDFAKAIRHIARRKGTSSFSLSMT